MNARTIVKSLHGMWVGSYGLVKCPCHDDRKPSLKIKDDKRKSDAIDLVCFAGCSWQDVKGELVRQGLIDSRRSSPMRRSSLPRAKAKATASTKQSKPPLDEQAKQQIAFRLWDESVPLPDTLGWRYFTERRSLHIGVLGDLSHALRWHDGIMAVVGLMTDPLTNKPTGIHRTFLNSDGTNVIDDSGKKKKLMLGPRGVIRLSRDEDVTTGLGITEGIEDGLAVLLSGWSPIWCATCAGAIKSFPVLPGIEALTVFADCDAVGMKAAQSCPDRWRRTNQCDVAIKGMPL
jgi:hypothetical protein